MKPAECRLTTTGNAQILFIKNKSDAKYAVTLWQMLKAMLWKIDI